MAQQGDPETVLQDTQPHERRRELLGTYKTVNAELADLTWTLAELEQQIATLTDEAAVSPSPSASRRLDDLQRWQDTLEERILRLMYRADELMAAIERLPR
jgi:predicted  nucleic acid-binding Zn-ribbon protein